MLLTGRFGIYAAMFTWLIVCGAAVGQQRERNALSAALIDRAEKKYGAAAKTRLLRWQALIPALHGKAEIDKLDSVNRFFNQTPFISDLEHWGRMDYWATPAEMIASNGGDCEDFAIAKYFTLLAAGISPEKMRITYVLARTGGGSSMAHMVLAYYAVPEAEPLVLDNLKKQILKASQRTDLTAVYHFNGTGLWLAKTRTKGSEIPGRPDNMSIWRDLNLRMAKELQ